MVLQTRDDEVTIKWYDGSWSGKWKVYTYKESRNSESVAWVETLPIGDIIIGKIELTKSCSLPKATKEKLRDLYNSLDSPADTTQPTDLAPNSVQVCWDILFLMWLYPIRSGLMLLVIKLYCGHRKKYTEGNSCKCIKHNKYTLVNALLNSSY